MNEMYPYEHAQAAGEELRGVLAALDEDELKAFTATVFDARRIFVTGAGRTGLVMRCFAMRLMHFGFEAYVVGETTTPPAGPGDLLVVGSGSGATTTAVAVATKALGIGAQVALVTALPKSKLADLAGVILIIPGAIHGRHGTSASPQPAGNAFEQALLVSLDSVAMALADATSVELGGTLPRHANLE